MKNESEVSQDIQIEAMHHACNLMRNNSGSLPDVNGTPVRFGLGNISKKHNDKIKSSDLIGITKVTITPEMVGKTLGIFTAIEVKKEAWNPDKKFDARETAQNNFINWVKLNGGIASFCNDSNELVNVFNEQRLKLTS